jgi:hypothetical protein
MSRRSVSIDRIADLGPRFAGLADLGAIEPLLRVLQAAEGVLRPDKRCWEIHWKHLLQKLDNPNRIIGLTASDEAGDDGPMS